MNRFEDEIARELIVTFQLRKPIARVLARWAAASADPGALTADVVGLVRTRLEESGGDADALAEVVREERPDRFGRNWGAGPAH